MTMARMKGLMIVFVVQREVRKIQRVSKVRSHQRFSSRSILWGNTKAWARADPGHRHFGEGSNDHVWVNRR